MKNDERLNNLYQDHFKRQQKLNELTKKYQGQENEKLEKVCMLGASNKFLLKKFVKQFRSEIVEVEGFSNKLNYNQINLLLKRLNFLSQKLPNANDDINPNLNENTIALNEKKLVLESSVPYTTEGDLMADKDSLLPDQTDPGFTGEKVDVAINLKKPLDIVKKIITKTSKDVTDDLSKPLVTPGKTIEKKGKFTILPEAGAETTETVIKKMAKPDPTAEVDKLLFDPTSSLDFNNLAIKEHYKIAAH